MPSSKSLRRKSHSDRSLKENGPELPTEMRRAIETQEMSLSSDTFASTLDVAKKHFSFGRRHLRNSLAFSYGVAAFYRDNPFAYGKDFCTQHEWVSFKGNKPSEAHPEKALYYVVRFAIGLSNTQGQKYASKYVLALQQMFDDGVPAVEVPARLKNGGGIEKMANANRVTRKDDFGRNSTNKPKKRILAKQVEALLRSLEIEAFRAALADFEGMPATRADTLRGMFQSFAEHRIADLRCEEVVLPPWYPAAQRLSDCLDGFGQLPPYVTPSTVKQPH